MTWNAKHKKNICRNEEFKQKKQNEELETGMVVCKTASEHFGYKVKEEEPQERIITKIPDDQDIAIPPDYPSGYPTLSPSPINSWNREMVNVYELDSLLEHHISRKWQQNVQRMWLQSQYQIRCIRRKKLPKQTRQGLLAICCQGAEGKGYFEDCYENAIWYYMVQYNFSSAKHLFHQDHDCNIENNILHNI